MYKYEDFTINQNCLPENFSEFAFTKDKLKGLSLLSPIVFLPPILAIDEIFRPITGVVVRNIIPDRYYISNYGRLWDGFANRFLALHFSDPFEPNGYNPGYIKSKVAYYHDHYTIKSIDIYLHRIVMKVFGYFTGCEDFDVNHKDGDHANFRLSNLEFLTPYDNVKHAITNGLVQGRKIPSFNFTDIELHKICKLIAGGLSDSEIFNCTLVPMSAINQIRCKIIGTNISSMYTFPIKVSNYKSNRISEETVHEICNHLSIGMNPTEIAKMYGLGRHIINDIKFGRNYTYISSQYNIPIKDQPFISDDLAHKICKLLEDGYTNISVARQLDVSPNIVASIKCGRSANHISSKYKIPKPKKYTNNMSDSKVIEICELLEEKKYSDVNIATKVGVTYNMVRDIRLGYSYRHIVKNYNF